LGDGNSRRQQEDREGVHGGIIVPISVADL